MSNKVEVDDILRLIDSCGLYKLGQGQFAQVYKTISGMVIYFVRGDQSKKFTAVGGKHAPNIAYLGKVETGWGKYDCFVGELYRKPLKSAPLAAKLESAWTDFMGLWRNGEYNTLTEYCDGLVNEFALRFRGENPDLIDTIYKIWYNVRHFNEYCLEFPIKNLAEDQDGNLILLDVIFSI